MSANNNDNLPHVFKTLNLSPPCEEHVLEPLTYSFTMLCMHNRKCALICSHQFVQITWKYIIRRTTCSFSIIQRHFPRSPCFLVRYMDIMISSHHLHDFTWPRATSTPTKPCFPHLANYSMHSLGLVSRSVIN